MLHVRKVALSLQQLGIEDTCDSLDVCAVDGGERAVMYDRIRGVLDEPVGEGTHFRLPWLQTPNIMDIRTRPRTISSVTGTKGESSHWAPSQCLIMKISVVLHVCGDTS